MASNTLPDQIPPQSTPWSYTNEDGEQVIEIHWYLFLYGLWIQVASLIGGGAVLPPAVNVPMIDLDADTADLPQLARSDTNLALLLADVGVDQVDALQSARQIVNAMLLQPDSDVGPSLRDLANALTLALDGLQPDPAPRAQPTAAVTVGASPFTFTAPAGGAVAISGGAVSAIALIRQGVSVPTGVIAGVLPVSRLDQVQITYTVAPTVNFLPM